MTAILILLLPLSSFAGECEPLADIHARTNFCLDNPNYVPPANDCRDRYKAVVRQKQAEIRKLLAAQVSTGQDKAQNLKFGTTQTVYTSTENTLTELINQGSRVLSEVGAYGDDFVPPVPSWASGHWKPDRKNPAEKARSLDYYCWAEPMKDIDKVLAEVQTMVDELVATRKKTVMLHEGTSERKTNLADLGDEGGGAASAHLAGKSDRDSSTITGKIKNETLAKTESTGKIQVMNFGSEPGGNLRTGRNLRPSTITEENRAFFRGFSGTLGVPGGKAPLQASATSAQAITEATSSGAILWREPSDSNKINLEMSIPAVVTAPAPASLESASRGPAASSFTPSELVRPLGSSGFQARLALVAHDVSLFAAVRRCYRKTDLFHRP